MRIVLCLVVLMVTGCAPTLDYQKASPQEVKREQVIQGRMAVQIRQQREQRLARVANRLQSATKRYCRSINPSRANCFFPVNLVDDQGLNAFADGEKVYIPTGMLRFSETDDELAYVVSHELAHNILNHLGKKSGNAALGTVFDILVIAATGVDTQGAFANAGRGAYSQAFEAEADYLGVYIAASAGYDVAQAPLIWRKMAVENQAGIVKQYNSSHPSTPERFVALSNTVDEISNKLDMGLALMPNSKNNLDDQQTAIASVSQAVTSKPRASLADKSLEKKMVLGQQNYSVARLAKAEACLGATGFAPEVSMVDKQGPVELYDAFCSGAATLRYRCEWQACERVAAE